jgi:hypothetical protein
MQAGTHFDSPRAAGPAEIVEQGTGQEMPAYCGDWQPERQPEGFRTNPDCRIRWVVTACRAAIAVVLVSRPNDGS